MNDKPLIIFKCNCLLTAEQKDLIRNDLKKQIEEGIVVTDISLDYAKTLLPKDCKCEVIVETYKEGKIVTRTLKKAPNFLQKLFKKKNRE